MLYFTNSETKNNDEKSEFSTVDNIVSESKSNLNAAQVLWKKTKEEKEEETDQVWSLVFFFCTLCFSREMTEFRQKHRQKNI